MPRPCEGGVLELSGVYGGSFSFSRSAAFSSSKATSRLLNSSIRASSVAISASFSALDNEEESNGAVTHTLTHIARRNASASILFRSEEHTSELQSHLNLVCRLLLEK